MAATQTIKEAMKARHITQKELAERLSVSQSTVSNYINGTYEMPDKTRLEIAEILGLESADFEGIENDWKNWPSDFTCPRCNSRAVSEFFHHADHSSRITCGFCGLDSGWQREREKARKIFASFRPVRKSELAEIKHASDNGVRVLTLAELLDSSQFDSDDVRPVWFENRGLFCCPALLQFGIAEREIDSVRVEWHKSFGQRTFELIHYNSFWRCWAEKPTQAQCDNVIWDK